MYRTVLIRLEYLRISSLVGVVHPSCSSSIIIGVLEGAGGSGSHVLTHSVPVIIGLEDLVRVTWSLQR